MTNNANQVVAPRYKRRASRTALCPMKENSQYDQNSHIIAL